MAGPRREQEVLRLRSHAVEVSIRQSQRKHLGATARFLIWWNRAGKRRDILCIQPEASGSQFTWQAHYLPIRIFLLRWFRWFQQQPDRQLR